MNLERVFALSFAGIYPLYVKKVESKGRTKAELEEVLCWLTGYSPKALAKEIAGENDLETFFGDAPRLNPAAKKITGTICGVRIEEIEHPLMRKIRYMDKLVDELAKGRPMEKILRSSDEAAVARAKPARATKATKSSGAGRRKRPAG
jgi:hypothetical protein